MSKPRECDGLAARQRQGLPRQRKKLRVELRMGVYEKLLRLTAVPGELRPLSVVAVIERLVEAANE